MPGTRQLDGTDCVCPPGQGCSKLSPPQQWLGNSSNGRVCVYEGGLPEVVRCGRGVRNRLRWLETKPHSIDCGIAPPEAGRSGFC